jgi:hypothetical protein
MKSLRRTEVRQRKQQKLEEDYAIEESRLGNFRNASVITFGEPAMVISRKRQSCFREIALHVSFKIYKFVAREALFYCTFVPAPRSKFRRGTESLRGNLSRSAPSIADVKAAYCFGCHAPARSSS